MFTTMARNPHISFISLLLVLSLLQGTFCVQYIVTNNAPNTPGGHRFDTEIGIPFTVRTGAKEVNELIWKLFKQIDDTQRKNVPVVNINITTNLKDDAWGETVGDTVYVNSKALEIYFPPDEAQFEITSLMYHEMTHVFQWSGKGTAPRGLIEGVGEYVKIKSKYYHPEDYIEHGEGDKWDERNSVTARFLEYCDSLRPEFTVNLNNMMREVYKDEYFHDLLGKSLDQVWKEYKAKYGH